VGLSKAKQILECTHAKQNISIVKKTISDVLKLSDKENRKPTIQVRELLWHGNINGIANLVRENLARRKSAAEAALKK
jgi:hypothetical protein